MIIPNYPYDFRSQAAVFISVMTGALNLNVFVRVYLNKFISEEQQGAMLPLSCTSVKDSMLIYV